jgi:hypothetical protein
MEVNKKPSLPATKKRKRNRTKSHSAALKLKAVEAKKKEGSPPQKNINQRKKSFQVRTELVNLIPNFN